MFTPDERWQFGTHTPAEIQELVKQEHDGREWRLLNTITNLMGVCDSVQSTAANLLRQNQALREIVALASDDAPRKSFQEDLELFDAAGLLTPEQRAEWLTPEPAGGADFDARR